MYHRHRVVHVTCLVARVAYADAERTRSGLTPERARRPCGRIDRGDERARRPKLCADAQLHHDIRRRTGARECDIELAALVHIEIVGAASLDGNRAAEGFSGRLRGRRRGRTW